MRFAVAHKTTSYAMVACAFLALVSGGGGGGLSPLVMLGGAAALVASWWWEPPRVRVERWTLLWNLATVVVFAWATTTALLSFDWFGTGGTFIVWLVVAKAFNRKTSKDWQQLYLLSFLMLVAGSVFNEGLSYALAFLGFVLASTWALILSHLRREMEDNFLLKHATDDRSERVEVQRILQSRRIVGGRFFVGTGLVSIGVFALAAMIFASIPRVGAGFFTKRRGGLTFAGFRDGVKLGGHGTIKYDDTVVMRVEIAGPYQGRSAPYIHWRGVAFDEYDGGVWRRSARAPRTSTVYADGEDGRVRRELEYAGLPPAGVAGAVEQTIWLESLDSDVLFGASMPVAFEHARPNPRRRRGGEQNDEVRLEHRSGIQYTVWSVIEPPPASALRVAPDELPFRAFEVFTRLPPSITPETRALAERITAGLTNDYDRAVAIEAWLRENLAYTLELAEAPPGVEPVHFFLFDRKAGHCEYFSSAFAVLARAVGVPTRNVNGFLGGEWNEYDDYIAVRAGDAHSWNEVWFTGVGWVTFDATPASQDRLGRGGGGLAERARRFLDTLRFQWFKWVIEYDLSRQLGLFRDVGGAFQDAGRWVGARWRDVRSWVSEHAVLVITLGLALAALIGWRVRRRRRGGPRGEARERPRPRSPVAQQYARVLARLARRGLPRAPAMTPRELARDVASRGLPFAAALGELTEIYYAAQWGGDGAPELLERARALATEIETSPMPR